MTGQVKRRAYSGARRQREAAERRARVLRVGLERFLADGYHGTSMARVAREAGVAVDTVYATIGRKPQLLLAVHDLILGDGATDEHGQPVPALQRQYVAEVRAARTAEEKIGRYADALGRLLPRTAPLLDALREAGATDPECRAVWESLEARRADNMRLFVADLRSTGQLRADLDDDLAADLVWSMNAAPYFLSLARRGRTPEQYAELVRQVWVRTLVEPG